MEGGLTPDIDIGSRCDPPGWVDSSSEEIFNPRKVVEGLFELNE
jgi:hypothetical protein